MTFKSLEELNVKNMRVLVRVDLNVPRQGMQVTDTTRIDRLKPTIDYLRKNGARILILSHFGRPEGEANPQMSLAFLTSVLEEQWQAPVKFSPQCIGDVAQDIANATIEGDIVLMENVRFHKGEKANDADFSKKLAALGDIYVNDAFSTSHRAHASTEGISHYLPSVAGLLMAEELSALTKALDKPKKPVLAVAGGSKISTKLGVLTNLVEKVDYLVLGGGMANTFLYAQGYDLGRSLCEKDMKDTALNIIAKAKDYGCEIILPKDVIVVEDLKENAPYQSVGIDAIPSNSMAIDIGDRTISYISDKINTSKTIVWNGPMGVFEIKPFDNGTNKIAQIVAQHTQAGQCTSVAGGGDTIAALDNAGALNDFSYISTAGGAFLEWLEGKELPSIEALKQHGTKKTGT